jgi:hypothetical protein
MDTKTENQSPENERCTGKPSQVPNRQRKGLTRLRSASKREQEKVTAGGAILDRVRVSNRSGK